MTQGYAGKWAEPGLPETFSYMCCKHALSISLCTRHMMSRSAIRIPTCFRGIPGPGAKQRWVQLTARSCAGYSTPTSESSSKTKQRYTFTSSDFFFFSNSQISTLLGYTFTQNSELFFVMTFDKWVQECNHHHTHDLKHLHYPWKGPCATLWSLPPWGPDPCKLRPTSCHYSSVF